MKYRTKLCLIAAAGGVLSLSCYLYDLKSRDPIQYLTRPQSGAGDENAELQAELEGKTYPVRVKLKAVPYKEQEQRLLLKEAYDGLGVLFLKENGDFEHIMEDVSMPSVYPGTQIAIRWYLDTRDCVKSDGTVQSASLKAPQSVKVQAVLSLGAESLVWEQKIVVCPPKIPDTEQKLQMLDYELLEAQETAAERVLLPDTVAGTPVVWYRKADDRWLWFLVLTALTVGAVAAGRKKEADTALRKKERGMQLDYPEIVSRLSLYMGAGISTRKAWERIVDNYEKKGKPDAQRHAAYEEMRVALHEMQSGVAESVAYERFGSRCRMPAYLKLGTLLSQNLRKGTRNLAGLLKEESREAFESRKALAKRMGEECESKLLLPMIMMLLTILIVIMYPAATSFHM